MLKKTAKRTAVAALAVTLGAVFGLAGGSAPGAEPAMACPDDSVLSGTVCMDRYEASLWYVPGERKGLVARIQNGTVTLQALMAGNAVQLGLATGDLAAAGCPANGNGCVDVYAVSIAGVRPAGFNTYYQAVAAARNARKRLPTNQEWQAAALGTPDGAPCNVGPDEGYGTDPTAIPAESGSSPGCMSDAGAFDMVGNLWERVAEWADFSGACTTLAGAFGGDMSCFGGSAGTSAVIRGGFFGSESLGGGGNAGVFAVRANVSPDFAPLGIGLRCVR